MLFRTYIGKLLLLYAFILILLLGTSIPIVSSWVAQKNLELERISIKRCSQCMYEDAYQNLGLLGLKALLDDRRQEHNFSYLLFNIDETESYGNLDLSNDMFGAALREHFAFTDTPINLSYDMSKQVVKILYQLSNTYFLYLEDDMAANQQAMSFLTDTLHDQVNVNALSYLVIAILLSLFGFILTAFAGLKIKDKITGISDTASVILEQLDLTQRIPTSKNEDEFNKLAIILNSMLAAIESKVNDITSMSNVLAHELKTPLARMKYQMLEQTDRNPSLSSLNDSLDNVIRTFDSALRICRLEAGHAVLDKHYAVLGPIVDEAIDFLLPLAEKNGQTIQADISTEAVFFDKALLSQAMVNLIENAIKYSGCGCRIFISSKISKRYYEVTVFDSGSGIPDALLPKVTSMYVKGEKDQVHHGVGLGLHMVNAIAIAHGGKIKLTNQVDGFSVALCIPISDPEIL